MAVREILKMGDPRLLRVAQPVREFDTPQLHALIADMQPIWKNFLRKCLANTTGLEPGPIK